MGDFKSTNSQNTQPKPPAPKPPPPVLTPVPLAKQIRGVDLSHHNESVSFPAMKGAGIQFAFLKATEGQSMVDEKFVTRRAACRASGILFGAYHFFRADVDPKKQAEHFLKTIGDVPMGDLPCVLDWETLDGVARTEHAKLIKVFLDIVERETGRLPIIYSGSSFATEMNLPLYFARYSLWLAHYTTGTPRVPRPWVKYTFWQNSESGLVTGVGKCDTNYFNGTRADLEALAGIAVPLTVA